MNAVKQSLAIVITFRQFITATFAINKNSSRLTIIQPLNFRRQSFSTNVLRTAKQIFVAFNTKEYKAKAKQNRNIK